MSTVARVDIQREPNGVVRAWFVCPGCGENHAPVIEASSGPVWGFNGDVNRPTFTPSLRVRWPANPEAVEEFKEWRTDRVCHSFITDGRIQFLSDCTHALAGQTVDLPEVSQ